MALKEQDFQEFMGELQAGDIAEIVVLRSEDEDCELELNSSSVLDPSVVEDFRRRFESRRGSSESVSGSKLRAPYKQEMNENREISKQLLELEISRRPTSFLIFCTISDRQLFFFEYILPSLFAISYSCQYISDQKRYKSRTV